MTKVILPDTSILPDLIEKAKSKVAVHDDIIIEVRHRGQTVVVRRTTPAQIRISEGPTVDTSALIGALGRYGVFVDDVLRHPDCDPESVMRALGHYLHDGT